MTLKRATNNGGIVSYTIIAYKAFDKDWKCRGYQYKVGETYTHDGDVSLCNSGFHACEAPLDVLNYYPLLGSQFARVELGGMSKQTEADTKRVGKSITIKAALSIQALILAQVEWILAQVKEERIDPQKFAASSGNYSTAACDTNGFACVAGLSGYEPEEWAHCGEVGRAVPGDVPYPQFCRHPDICRGLSICPRDPTCAD
jgi:hypothetical protein